MADKSIQIAEALRDSLNAGTFTETFTATAERLADFTRESITGTTVVVYPEGVAEEQYTRSKREETLDVGLAVFKPCEADAEDNIGDGLLLCQEIREAIAGVAMSGCDWTGTTQPELYEREFAEQLNQFASTLTATYKREV